MRQPEVEAAAALAGGKIAIHPKTSSRENQADRINRTLHLITQTEPAGAANQKLVTEQPQILRLRLAQKPAKLRSGRQMGYAAKF
jgi:hypothetical protein